MNQQNGCCGDYSWSPGTFEEYHNLIIEDEAIDEAVELSVRYITERFLPDKAIDLIDEACSAKSMTYVHAEDEIKISNSRQKHFKKILQILWHLSSIIRLLVQKISS